LFDAESGAAGDAPAIRGVDIEHAGCDEGAAGRERAL
jgi:hypothetical protein